MRCVPVICDIGNGENMWWHRGKLSDLRVQSSILRVIDWEEVEGIHSKQNRS